MLNLCKIYVTDGAQWFCLIFDDSKPKALEAAKVRIFTNMRQSAELIRYDNGSNDYGSRVVSAFVKAEVRLRSCMPLRRNLLQMRL